MDIESVILSSETLPPAPQIIPKIQQLLRNEETQTEDLARAIKADMSLATQIIRVGNSAYFAGANQVTGVEGAVNRIGFRETFRVVSAVAAEMLLGGEMEVYNLKKGQLWEQSLACAIAMEDLARTTAENVDNAYTCGLLHGIGKVVINNFFEGKGMAIYGDDDEEDPTPRLEQQILGFTSPEVAASVLRKWNFPDEHIIPIEFQYEPLEAPAHEVTTCLLSLAMTCSRGLIEGYIVEQIVGEIDPEIIEATRLTEERLEICFLEVKDRLENLEQELAGA